MNGDENVILIGIDAAIDYATLRNGGFCNILYTAEELLEIAVGFLLPKLQGQSPQLLRGSRYDRTTETDQDREYYVEVLGQLVTLLQNNVLLVLKQFQTTVDQIVCFSLHDYALYALMR